MEHIKRVGRELMYKGSMLEFYKDTIVTPDGKTAYWDHIELIHLESLHLA